MTGPSGAQLQPGQLERLQAEAAEIAADPAHLAAMRELLGEWAAADAAAEREQEVER